MQVDRGLPKKSGRPSIKQEAIINAAWPWNGQSSHSVTCAINKNKINCTSAGEDGDKDTVEEERDAKELDT